MGDSEGIREDEELLPEPGLDDVGVGGVFGFGDPSSKWMSQSTTIGWMYR